MHVQAVIHIPYSKIPFEEHFLMMYMNEVELVEVFSVDGEDEYDRPK